MTDVKSEKLYERYRKVLYIDRFLPAFRSELAGEHGTCTLGRKAHITLENYL